jgi:CHASE3 domain sensor protein
MTPHERLVLQEALQAEADRRREAMRKQEQAFGAVVCVVCIIIISCVAVGAGFRSVRNMVEARQAQQEVRK